jgi:hypothetical protein
LLQRLTQAVLGRMALRRVERRLRRLILNDKKDYAKTQSYDSLRKTPRGLEEENVNSIRPFSAQRFEPPQ